MTGSAGGVSLIGGDHIRRAGYELQLLPARLQWEPAYPRLSASSASPSPAGRYRSGCSWRRWSWNSVRRLNRRWQKGHVNVSVILPCLLPPASLTCVRDAGAADVGGRSGG